MLFSPIFTYLVYMQSIANILLCNLKKKIHQKTFSLRLKYSSKVENDHVFYNLPTNLILNNVFFRRIN